MNLIPPTHGRAGVRSINSREYLDRVGEDAVRREMVSDLNRHFQAEIGVDAPRAWLSWEVVETPGTDEVDVRLSAEAPTRARTYLDALRGSVRTVPIAVTHESRIPIVANPYPYGTDNPYRRDDHVLTFAGWDAETGLMVFDR